MRLVIDKNCFAEERFRKYLAASRDNIALLARHATMECYAGKDPHKNLMLSTAIILEFPEQVFMLKDPESLMLLGYIDSQDTMTLVDTEQTRQLSGLRALTIALANGDPGVREFVSRQGQEAEKIRLEALAGMASWRAIIDLAFQYPWPQTIAKVRRGEQLDEKEFWRMLEFGIDAIAEGERADDERLDLPRWSSRNAYYYKYRWAIAMWWLAMDWVQKLGSQKTPLNNEKLRNDVIDLEYLIPATYFDGLMSDDEKMKRIYSLTLQTLSALANFESRRHP
jgi:hypothetical protein